MSNHKAYIVTIDGPGGVGKSSLASMLAQALNIPMLDTGAMYRALAHYLGAEAMDMDDTVLEIKARTYIFTLDNNTASANLLCNGIDINTLPIRSPRVTRLSTLVAQLPIIRQVLQENQQNIAKSFSIIVEGRDMGTKVFPHAQCKFFLDASPEIRAQRRHQELTQKGEQSNYQDLYEELLKRDHQDRSRSIDPLKPAENAICIDTSNMDIHQVFHLLIEHIKDIKEKMEHNTFSHLDSHGNACMVDVGHKEKTERKAIVACTVHLNPNTLKLLKEKALPKGDVLNTAKVAGILAAKQTGFLIPMCHPLSITYADIRFEIEEQNNCIHIHAEVHTTDKTGVEMEAMIAAQIAAATIYDMCKAVQKDIVINQTRLIYKSGGKSGELRFE